MGVTVVERPVAGIGDTALFARQAGRGAPALFVHGAVSDHRTWDGVFEAVADRATAVAYSRRGYRPNPRPQDESYRFEEQLDDLVAVIDGFGSGNVALVGHSSGAVLALLAAARRPSRVGRAVLIEPPCFTLFVGDPPKPGELARLLVQDPALAVGLIRFGATALGPAQAALRRGDRRASLRRFGRGVLGRRGFRRLPARRREQMEQNLVAGEILGPAFPRIDPEEVGRINCPVLIVAGTASPRFQRILARRLADRLRQADLVDVPGASHFVHEDAPDAFRRILLDFLARES